jgi:predicted DNA-binding helix-hairpin-helix protein
MLVLRTPDTGEKVHALSRMATDDVLSPRTAHPRAAEGMSPVFGAASPGARDGSGARDVIAGAPYSASEKNPMPGVYRAQMPGGRSISLFRVMLTDFCKMDCHYCPNSHWVPRKRFAFKVDELAKVFHDLQSREVVAGMFLSSGIFGSGSKTTERMLQVVDAVRNRYGFKGYVHLKVMPGTSRHLVEEAFRLGTRVSVNIETDSPDSMRKLSRMKDFEQDLIDPIRWSKSLIDSRDRSGAVGQATQMVVGAAGESDAAVHGRAVTMYGDFGLKRVYYVAFRPVRFTPLEEAAPAPTGREHRLYQVDWLKRVYGFEEAEIGLAFDRGGYLSLEQDPKTVIAMENIDAFPVDVNRATLDELLRVPGIGPLGAQRIVRARRRHSVGTWRDLVAMGVVQKRAWPYVRFPGHRPSPGAQLRLDLFREGREAESASRSAGARALPVVMESRMAYAASGVTVRGLASAGVSGGAQEQHGAAPCGAARGCAGCPLYGSPGHPGGGMADAGDAPG